MSKTLTCPGPPSHTFEHAGGRGRPPKYCDEHRPAKPERKTKVKPEPTETPERVNPFIAKAEQQKKKAKIAPALEANKEKRRIEAKRAEELLELEFEGIDEREREAYERYDEANKIANAQPLGKDKDTDDPKLWHKVAMLQNTAINVSARKRWLYDYFEKKTNGDEPDEVDQIWEGHPTVPEPVGTYIDDSTPGDVGTTGVLEDDTEPDLEKWLEDFDALVSEDA